MDETSQTLKENPTPISETEQNPISMAETSETTPKETPTDIAEILKKTVIGESSGTTGIPNENPPATIEGSSRENHVGSFSFDEIEDSFFIVEYPEAAEDGLLYDGVQPDVKEEHFIIPPTCFSFGMKPAKEMKLAVKALVDSEFNPEWLAKISVSDMGFSIDVHNHDSHIAASLGLESTGLIYFKCSKSVKNKEIKLATFSDSLNDVDDKDTLTIELLDGSTALSVKYGRLRTEAFTVELCQPMGFYYRMPRIVPRCQADLRTKDLRTMIEFCDKQKEQPQKVVAKLRLNHAEYRVPGDKETGWKCYYQNNLKLQRDCTSNIVRGEEYTVEFMCLHGSSLRKASLLGYNVEFTLLKVPIKHIILRFPVHTSSLVDTSRHLVYIMEAVTWHLEML